MPNVSVWLAVKPLMTAVTLVEPIVPEFGLNETAGPLTVRVVAARSPRESLTRTDYRPPLSELGVVNVQVAAPLLSDEQVVGLVVSVVYEPDPGDVSIWRVRVWLAVKPVMVAVTVAP